MITEIFYRTAKEGEQNYLKVKLHYNKEQSTFFKAGVILSYVFLKNC